MNGADSKVLWSGIFWHADVSTRHAEPVSELTAISQSDVRTIEGDIFAALIKAGAVSADNADDHHKVDLQRSARTDSGVHAAGNWLVGCDAECMLKLPRNEVQAYLQHFTQDDSRTAPSR